MQKALYHSGRTIIELYTRLALDMDQKWHAPMPHGPKLIVANHPTTTDPFYILSLTREPMSILVTGAAFDVPVLGRYLRLAGHVPVVKESGRAAFDEALQLLRARRTVTVFPEGALSPLEGGVNRPHTGAARLALSAGVPVVPVGIGLLPDRKRSFEADMGGSTEVGILYPSGPYAWTVGEAVCFEGPVEDREHVRRVSDQIMARIGSLALESARRVEQAQGVEPQIEPVGALRLQSALDKLAG